MRIGLTGGIGSGKTIISQILISMGYPVFNSDYAAKECIANSVVIRGKIQKLLGVGAYKNGIYQTGYVSAIVFNDKKKLDQLNEIVHPEVRSAFNKFTEKNSSSLVFNEAAILFETGAYKSFDKTILIVSPADLRIRRLLKRDGANREEIQLRMSKQWSDERKITRADYVIQNNEKDSILEQVHQVLNLLKQQTF